VVGNPDTIFVLPDSHRIAVQLHKANAFAYEPYQLGEYFKTWSTSLEPLETVAEYAASFTAFATKAEQTPEFLSDSVWEALSSYFRQKKFRRDIPADFDLFALADDRPALENYDYFALEDGVNFELLQQDLDRLPFSVKDQSSPLAQVTEQSLQRILKLANPETNEFFAQDFGRRLLDLAQEYGTRILFWYQQNFETSHHITFIGFGSKDFEPEATHVRFGGRLGTIALAEFSNPFQEVWLRDSSYEKRWYGNREEELVYFESQLAWRLQHYRWLPAERTLELVELKRAAKRFLTEWESEPITLVNITKEEITQK
jgi:hypothetical protein